MTEAFDASNALLDYFNLLMTFSIGIALHGLRVIVFRPLNGNNLWGANSISPKYSKLLTFRDRRFCPRFARSPRPSGGSPVFPNLLRYQAVVVKCTSCAPNALYLRQT